MSFRGRRSEVFVIREVLPESKRMVVLSPTAVWGALISRPRAVAIWKILHRQRSMEKYSQLL